MDVPNRGTWFPVDQIAEPTLKNNTEVYSMEATTDVGLMIEDNSKSDRVSGQFSR